MLWPKALTWFKDQHANGPPSGNGDAVVLLHAEPEHNGSIHISAMPSCVRLKSGKPLAWVSDTPFDIVSHGGIQGGVAGTISSAPQGGYEVATATVSGNTGETHHYHLRFFKKRGGPPFAEDMSSPVIIID